MEQTIISISGDTLRFQVKEAAVKKGLFVQDWCSCALTPSLDRPPLEGNVFLSQFEVTESCTTGGDEASLYIGVIFYFLAM